MPPVQFPVPLAALALGLGLLAAPGAARAACVVTLSSPASGSVQSQSPTFKWSASGCTKYAAWFSPSGTFGADTVKTSFKTAKQHRFDEATWDGYQAGAWAAGVSWRVRGKAADGSTTDSAVRRIAMDPDLDDDGVSVGAGDCDDADPAVRPGALEACNGIDDDCDFILPEEEMDIDQDGLATCEGDCNDVRDTAFPGAAEVCDGVDSDCDGVLPLSEVDADGDGAIPCFGDCDDDDPEVRPLAVERCDGVDQDCNGLVDEGPDADGDGFYGCGDCDDTRAAVHPGATEVCDGRDDDCDGVVDGDGDLDGFGVCEDCDDARAEVNPGVFDFCNGEDDDCDGDADPDCGGFPPFAGDLVITEVMRDPTLPEPGGEWVEILNVSDVDIVLDGLTLEDDFGSWAFPLDHVLGAGEYLVVAGSPAPGGDPYSDSPYYWGSALSLGNGVDRIELRDGDVLIDSVSWDDSGSYPSTEGRAMSLDPDLADAELNDDPASWCAATTPWAPGNYGTPKAENPACP